jgi:Ca-activated chloride channel family protein
MKLRPASALLLAIALGTAGCALRDNAQQTPDREYHAAQQWESPQARPANNRPCPIPPAGQAQEPAGFRSDASPSDRPGVRHDEQDLRRDGLRAPASSGDQPQPVLARDLGEGAGGEKLGGFQRQREAPPRPALDWPFTDVDRPDGDTSTFSLSVHTGSASLVRQALLDRGRWPERDQVRAEELVNAFTYGDPRPSREDERPFRITAATVACPWDRSHQIVRVALTSRPLAEAQRPPANLVFLIDVSGSMGEKAKLPLLKRSLHLLVERLGADDRVAIVTYAGSASVALAPTPGDHSREILAAIDRLSAGGGTNGSDGLRQAYRLARQEYRRDGLARVILASDGDFNVGITDDGELARLIDGEARSGIYLTVLGMGMGGRQDRRLEGLADRGNGFYAYLDGDDEAQRLFGEQLPASLTTLAQDAKIQVFFNPTAVRGWRLLGYENRVLARRDFNDDRVDAGEIGAGHAVTALYEIVPAWNATVDDPNPFTEVADEARGEVHEGPALRVRLRWQPPGGGASQLMEQDVAASAQPATATGDTAWCLALTGFAHLLRDEGWYGSVRPTWREVMDLAETGLDGTDRAARREFFAAMEKARELAVRRR